MSAPPQPSNETDLSHAEVRAALERVVGSRTLGAARQLQAFLRFVVERTLAGDDARLKEYTIGTEVLGRGPDFDPKADGVVRVQAGLLRKKLAAYYGGEGRDDGVVIDIPKGGYVPVFARRTPASQALAAGGAGAPAGQAQVAAAPFGVAAAGPSSAAGASVSVSVAGAGEAAERDRRTRRIILAVALADAVLVAGLVAFFMLRDPNRRGDGAGAVHGVGGAATVAPADPSPWTGFFSGEAPTILAFGTPQFFEGGGVLLRDTRVNTPDELGATPRLKAIEKALGTTLEPSEVYTGIGEATGAVLLAQFFARQGRELRVLRSRHLGWSDVKDAHLVFLASMRFRTRADELGLPSDFVFSPEERGTIVNRRPAPGEPARYDAEAGADLATVTVAPGKTPGHRVLVLSGRNTWGTQGAAEYVTRPEHLAALRAELDSCRRRTSRPHHPDTFQVLLRIEIADHQPLTVKYVTHHDF